MTAPLHGGSFEGADCPSSPHPERRFRPLCGLRYRLLALVLLGVVPALVLLTYTNFELRAQGVVRVQEAAARWAHTAAATEERYILGTRQFLTAIAQTPIVRARSQTGHECDTYLEALKSRNPLYTVVAAADRNGAVYCSSTQGREYLFDRVYFADARRTRDFAIGPYIARGRVTGRPIVTFAQPILDKRGEFLGIVLASHDVERWIRQLGVDLGFPGGASLTLFDRDGMAIARFPEQHAVIGKKHPAVAAWPNADPEQIRLTEDASIIRADAPLVHNGQLGGTVRVELPADQVLAPLDHAFRRSFLLLSLVGMLAVAAAWFGGDLFVLRRTRALVAASKRLAEGDLSARTGVRYGRDELGHLARVFDGMAQSLETRQAQLVEAERVLAAARLASVLDITSDAIFRLDSDWRIEVFNRGAERVFGYAAADITGHRVTDLLAPDSVEAFTRRLAMFEREELLSGMEQLRVDARRKDGGTFPAEVTFSTVAEGSRTSFTVVLRDVTERVAAEASRLEMAQKLAEVQRLESLAALAGGVAHDFNNLLLAIMGNACLGLEQAPPGSPLHRYFAEIESASERAAALSTQMLAYSGRSRVVTRQLDVNDLVAETLSAMRPAIPDNVRIDLRLAPMVAAIDADPGQIKQLLVNLVTNAVEAIGSAPGEVVVCTGVTTSSALPDRGNGGGNPAAVFVKVTDTGEGIPDAVKTRIFEPFFSTKFTGRGLGLAVVSGVVRAHGGAVSVDSVPGRGSTFTVLFPASARSNRSARAVPPRAAHDARG